MLYYWKGEVKLMPGAERVAEVKELAREHGQESSTFNDILAYTWHAYAQKGGAFLGMPPAERRKYAIIDNGLFQGFEPEPGNEAWQQAEELPGVKAFITRYLEATHNHLQRQRLTILEKIEKYNAILADPEATFKQESEASEALELFNKRLDELETAILKEEEGGRSNSGAVHLYELPEDAKRLYRELGIEM